LDENKAKHGNVALMRPPAIIFGVPIADVTTTETIDVIDSLIRVGRARGRTHQIATVNVDFLVDALDDSTSRTILQHADLCLPDGMPVVWAARLLGMPIRQRVAGADLVPLLVDASQTRGWRVHVFGSTESVASEALALLRSRFPSANLTIEPAPIIRDVNAVDDEILDHIAKADADILCVALGNPKQEKFIDAHRERLRTPVMIGIGGSLDMLVGKRRRAPEWMQRSGLEWIGRAVQEPRRLGRRYLHDIRVFGPALARAYIANRRRRSGVGLGLKIAPGAVDVELTGDTVPDLAEWTRAVEAVRDGASLHVGATECANDRAVARLIGLVKAVDGPAAQVEWRQAGTRFAAGLAEAGIDPTLVEFPDRARNTTISAGSKRS
jgi:N-acetylglucosaminyldiphosphoundecaprenol N-acetyl-beta-D-mannosaminyltransferase